MTITTTENRYRYTGDGSTTAFSFPRYVEALTHIQVYVDDVLKTVATDYTIAGTASGGVYPSGVTVTFLTAPAAATKVVLYRAQPLTQEIATATLSAYRAASIEDGLNRAVLGMQKLSDDLSRTPKLAKSTALSDITFPAASASKLIRWNSGATDLEAVSVSEAGLVEDSVLLGRLLAENFTPTGGTATTLRTYVERLNPYASRAAAIAASVPAAMLRIWVLHDEVVLSYIRDASGTALTTADGATWSPDGKDFFVQHWGVGTSETAATNDTAIAAALSWMGTNRKGNLCVAPGIYDFSAQITMPTDSGLGLVGVGNSRESANSYPCVFRFTHTGAPAVRLRGDGQYIENMVIRATGARASAVLDRVAFGILMEPEDSVGAVLSNPTLRNVFVEGHPSDAVATSGDVFQPIWEGVVARDCKGHSFNMSDGRLTTRTNTARPGGLVARSLRTYACGGHDFVCDDTDTYGAYRLVIIDADFDNASRAADIDASIKLANAACIFHGENIQTINVAISGRISGTATHAAMRVSGRCHNHQFNRYIGVVSVAHAIVGTAIPTEDISVSGFISSDSTANPAVSITGSVGTIEAQFFTSSGSGALQPTSYFTAGYTAGIERSPTAIDYGAKQLRAATSVWDGATATAVSIQRDGAECAVQVLRTGSGAADGRMAAIGNQIRVGTFSANDLAFVRNSSVVGTWTATGLGVNETSPDYGLDVNGTLGFTPGTSVTPVDNGDVVFEFTNNTTLTIKGKGTDGTVRSATVTLA